MSSLAEPERCPWCGHGNDCQLCSAGADKGPCWCFDAVIPPELIDHDAPTSHSNRACICRHCVNAFHREQSPHRPAAKLSPGDFYFENGLIVFTAQYHRRRGFCCGSACRHCPYPKADSRHS